MPDPTRFQYLALYVFNQHVSEHGATSSDRNDIVQAGLLRLTMDMRRLPDADWDTLAYQCLYRGMQDEFRRTDHLDRGHRAEVKSGTGDAGPSFLPIDRLDHRDHPQDRDTAELVSEIQEAAILWRAIGTLPERQRKLTIALLEERKQRDVAAEIGVTESRLYQLKAAALSTLRVRLRAQGVHR